jgi:hypothetical protein
MAGFLPAARTVHFFYSEMEISTLMMSGAGLSGEPAKGLLTSSREYTRICEISSRLGIATTTGELGALLAREVSGYSLFDLQVIGGRLKCEVDNLPSPYREQIRPYFTEQLFGMHHSLMHLHRSGAFRKMLSPIRDSGTFKSYCKMVPQGCFSWDDGKEKQAFGYTPYHRLFYYLISGFAMFVLEKPGHPVGTPFPGGFKVEQKSGDFLCPIRDKEKEVLFSICNFCPAKQSDMP